MKRDLSFSDIGFLREARVCPWWSRAWSRRRYPPEPRAGAAAIWISNHGGRQMDGGPGSISVLRAAVDTVEGRVPVVLDSGIRRGVDISRRLRSARPLSARPAGAVGPDSAARRGSKASTADGLRAAIDDAAFGRSQGDRPQTREPREGLRRIVVIRSSPRKRGPSARNSWIFPPSRE